MIYYTKVSNAEAAWRTAVRQENIKTGGEGKKDCCKRKKQEKWVKKGLQGRKARKVNEKRLQKRKARKVDEKLTAGEKSKKVDEKTTAGKKSKTI